jgi:hypothetical protein
MPDETVPPLPKRPYKRKEPKKTPEEVEHEAMLLTVQEKACVLIAIEQNEGEAAIRLGLSLEEVREILASAPVKLYLAKLQEAEMHEIARWKARKFRQVGITRTAVEERLMTLAMMDPLETKGTIDGQVKALAALADKFGYAKADDPLAGKSPDELKAIVRKGHTLLLEGNAGVN